MTQPTTPREALACLPVVTRADLMAATWDAGIYPALGEPIQAARALSAGLPYAGRSFDAVLVDGVLIVSLPLGFRVES